MHALAGDKAAADADFVRGEAAGLTGGGFIDARDFEHHVAWKDNGDPEFGSALTFTHSDFRRTLGDGLVRENADEDLAFALEEAGEGHTAGFDLVVFDPATVEELEAEVTEIELVAAGGVATAIAALLFAVFGSAGEKCHDCLKWRFETEDLKSSGGRCFGGSLGRGGLGGRTTATATAGSGTTRPTIVAITARTAVVTRT